MLDRKSYLNRIIFRAVGEENLAPEYFFSLADIVEIDKTNDRIFIRLEDGSISEPLIEVLPSTGLKDSKGHHLFEDDHLTSAGGFRGYVHIQDGAVYVRQFEPIDALTRLTKLYAAVMERVSRVAADDDEEGKEGEV